MEFGIVTVFFLFGVLMVATLLLPLIHLLWCFTTVG